MPARAVFRIMQRQVFAPEINIRPLQSPYLTLAHGCFQGNQKRIAGLLPGGQAPILMEIQRGQYPVDFMFRDPAFPRRGLPWPLTPFTGILLDPLPFYAMRKNRRQQIQIPVNGAGGCCLLNNPAIDILHGEIFQQSVRERIPAMFVDADPLPAFALAAFRDLPLKTVQRVGKCFAAHQIHF